MIDGVAVTVTAPGLTQPLVGPPVDDAIQVASAVQTDPYSELSITAIPYGATPPTENTLPRSAPGISAAYRKALSDARASAQASPRPATATSLFGHSVDGVSSTVKPQFGVKAAAVMLVEWVTEAGGRTWIVRTANAINSPLPVGPPELSSTNVDAPSASTVARSAQPVAPVTPSGAFVRRSAQDIPTPTWWSGDCDHARYYAGSGINSYHLGAVFHGLTACGPRPYYNEGPDVSVRFFTNAWGELDFECVELSMRWLWLQYGVKPYGANGSDVVSAYPGNLLQKVTNPTIGSAPAPGDVLSYGAAGSTGHTSVVTAANVNASGNGTVSVIQQNASSNGSGTLTVSNWQVVNGDPVNGWLHDGAPPPPPPSTPLRELVNDGYGGRVWNNYLPIGSDGNFSGEPTTAANGDGLLHIFVRTSAGHMAEVINDGLYGRVWNLYDHTSTTLSTIAGRPSVVQVGGLFHIFANNTGSHLVEFVNDGVGGSVWNVYDHTAETTISVGGDPTPIWYNNALHVYVKATGSALLEFVPDGLHGVVWSGYSLTAGTSPMTGTPSPLVYGTLIHIYARNDVSQLMEFVNDGSGSQLWHAYNLSVSAGGSNGLVGDPAVSVLGSTVHVFGQGTTNNLIDFIADGLYGRAWNGYNLTSYTGQTVACRPAPFLISTTFHVYCRDTVNKLQEFVNDGPSGQWHAYDLSTASGGAPDAWPALPVSYGAAVHIYFVG